MNKENNYKILMSILFWIFLVFGVGMYIFPNLIISLFNTVSEKIGYFQIISQSNEMFYVDLSVAYMACVTAIAYLIKKDVKHNLNLTPVLIVGKTTSSLISLLSFIVYQRSLLYVTTFVTDGLIVLLVLVFYMPLKREDYRRRNR